MPYFLCSKEIKNNTDGTLAIDDFADFVTTEQCPKLEKCCSKNHYIPRPENDICKDSFFNTPEKCGWRNPKGLGGELRSEQNHTHYAQYAEFPWMIALLEQLNVNGSIVPFFRGGGSLIHPKVVLTTAHNIDGFDFEKLVIRAGEWDTQTENEICLHEERLVERVIKHEQFNRQNLQNDIALLVLKNEFQLTPFINTICLPPKGSNFDNRRCFTSGWGRNKFGREGFYQVFLKKMDLPIVSSSKCQDQLRKTRLGKDFELHEGFLCAGENFFYC